MSTELLFRVTSFLKALNNAQISLDSTYDKYVEGLQSLLDAVISKSKQEELNVLGILCHFQKGEEDRLVKLLKLSKYKILPTEKRDYPVALDEDTNNIVAVLTDDYRGIVALWLAITTLEFNTRELVKGCVGQKDLVGLGNGFRHIPSEPFTSVLMKSPMQRLICIHDYQEETLYERYRGQYGYPVYVPLLVERCSKCGAIKNIKRNCYGKED